MSYAKIHRDISESSINEENLAVRWLWVIMLTRSDENGIVKGTIGVQARAANIPLEDAEKAMEVLTSPDPNSRTQDEDGKRIIQVAPNLWSIVNHEYYRDLINYQSELEKSKVRSLRYREKRKQKQDRHASITDASRVDHDIQSTDSRVQSADETHTSVFESEFWDRWPKGRKIDKKKCERKFNRLSKKKQAAATGPRYQAWLDHWATIDTKFIPHPMTYLNAERWESDPPPTKKGVTNHQEAEDQDVVVEEHKKSCDHALELVNENFGNDLHAGVLAILDTVRSVIKEAREMPAGEGYRKIVGAEDLLLDFVSDEYELEAPTTTERRKLAREKIGLPVLY